MLKRLRANRSQKFGDWQLAIIVVLASTVLAVNLKSLLYGEISGGLFFVIGIMLVGANSGLLPAMTCAVASSLIFNFLIADPPLAFRLTTGDDLAPPAIFAASALVSGLLSGRLHDRAVRLSEANLQLQSLLATSRSLQRAASEDELFTSIDSGVPILQGASIRLFKVENSALAPIGEASVETAWVEAAQAALESAEESAARLGMTAFRLPGLDTTVGIMVIDNTVDGPVAENFLLALAQIVGLAFERIRLSSEVYEAKAQVHAEELKSTLLASVSHDIRTPITTIRTSASSLLAFGHSFEHKTSQKLLSGIVSECDRLNRLTANILELSRMQSASRHLKMEAVSILDVVNSVADRLRSREPDRHIRVNIFNEDVYVKVDFYLLELALLNLLENACNYSEPGTRVDIDVSLVEGLCFVSVIDQGVGIPLNEQSKVFERFYRVKQTEKSTRGSGLGLAIAKGFVEVSAGSINIESPVIGDRGTAVTISLPALPIG